MADGLTSGMCAGPYTAWAASVAPENAGPTTASVVADDTPRCASVGAIVGSPWSSSFWIASLNGSPFFAFHCAMASSTE